MALNIEHNIDLRDTTKYINTIKPVRENNSFYHYIAPLLSYDFGQANPFLENKALSANIRNYINNQYIQQNAQSISVYVKNFSDNKWAGVAQDEQYHPGSLLKVLIMMAYFREAQLDPNIFNKTFTYSSSTDAEVNSLQFHQPTEMVIGEHYSLNDLLTSMIANSDNGAETLLIDNVNRGLLNNAYVDLNIPNPDTTQGDYTISARQYSGFLRILYNSTYLTEQYSEQALGVMTKSTFKDGITAGLPANIIAAQKYGERVNADSSGNVQSIELHDCGIVYAPDHAYSICIMTKGSDIQRLTQVLKDISALVYGQLSGKN